MYFIDLEKLKIRNFINDDLSFISENDVNKKLIDEIEQIKNSFNDDFYSEGKKHLAIEIENEFAGMVLVNLDNPYIYLDFVLNPKYQTRVFMQLIIFNFIKYVHLLYKYRQMIIYTSKFDYLLRGILENFSFKRESYDKDNDLYTYTLYKQK